MSLTEAVDRSALAQLLQQARAGAASSDQQQQQAEGLQKLTLQSFIPLLVDFAEVQHLRCVMM
jgi:hypothetical protein